jgi:serine/threonine protein kinase
MAQCWDFGEKRRFSHTKVIFHDGDDYFLARLPDRYSKLEEIVVPKDGLTRIPKEHIWPLYEEGLTICSNPDRPEVYVKKPQLTGYSDSHAPSIDLLKEARNCELLMRNPHDNIARCYGCVVEHGRITGLCFEKCAEQLSDREAAGRLVDIDSCYQQIEAGLHHLHSLNLVHNDIRDCNVMFKTQDGEEVVIIDFDACGPQGLPIEVKSGPTSKGVHTMEFENDDYALKVLRKRLQIARSQKDRCACEGCIPTEILLDLPSAPHGA